MLKAFYMHGYPSHRIVGICLPVLESPQSCLQRIVSLQRYEVCERRQDLTVKKSIRNTLRGLKA